MYHTRIKNKAKGNHNRSYLSQSAIKKLEARFTQLLIQSRTFLRRSDLYKFQLLNAAYIPCGLNVGQSKNCHTKT